MGTEIRGQPLSSRSSPAQRVRSHHAPFNNNQWLDDVTPTVSAAMPPKEVEWNAAKRTSSPQRAVDYVLTPLFPSSQGRKCQLLFWGAIFTWARTRDIREI